VSAADSRNDGLLSQCPHNGCAFRCCEFQQGNYIVLYPGELQAAAARGASLSHLHVFDDDDHGGARATCRAASTATCDDGYKPLDCASYPLFPSVSADGVLEGLLKGQKCPLDSAALDIHAEWTLGRWEALAAASPAVAAWLAEVTLVGYAPVRAPDRLVGGALVARPASD
jgi:hypothetical protein